MRILPFLLLAALLLSVQATDLKSIERDVTRYKELSARTITKDAYSTLSKSLRISSAIQLTSITTKIANNELHIDATASIWGLTVTISIDVVIVNKKVDYTIVFTESSSSLAQVYQQLTGKESSILSTDVTSQSVTLTVSSYDHQNVKSGVQLNGEVTLKSGNTLDRAFHSIARDYSSAIKTTAYLFVPPALSPVDFKLSIDGAYTFSPHVVLTGVSMDMELTAAKLAITLMAQLHVSTDDGSSMTFDVSGSWNEQQGVDLRGSMEGQWNHPFGLQWLIVLSGQAYVKVANNQIDKISIAAQASTTFAKQSVELQIDISGQQHNNIDIKLHNIPIISSGDLVRAVMDSTSAPVVFGAMQWTGQIDIDITIVGGKLKEINVHGLAQKLADDCNVAKALTVLSNSLSVDVVLTIPFPNTKEFVLTVTETGPIIVAHYLVINTMKATIAPTSIISVEADVEFHIADNDVVDVIFKYEWKPQQSYQLQGLLNGKWSHPLGLQWLDVVSATATVNVASHVVSSIHFDASAQMTFADKPLKVDVEVFGEHLQNVKVAIEDIPLGVDTMQKILQQGANVNTLPALMREMVFGGTVDLVIANYDDTNTRAGFSMIIKVHLDKNKPHTIADALLDTFGASALGDPYSMTFDMQLFAPVFDSKATTVCTIDIKANSNIPVGQGMVAVKVGVRVDILKNGKQIRRILPNAFRPQLPPRDVQSDLYIYIDVETTIKDQKVSFEFTGKYVASTHRVDLSAQLTEAWVHPFGLQWLTINTAQIASVIQNGRMNDLKVIGGATVNYGQSSPASVTVTFYITGNKLENFYVQITGTFNNDWKNFFQSVAGIQAPDVISSQMNVDGNLQFTLANYDGAPEKKGLTIRAHVQLADGYSLNKAARLLIPGDGKQISIDLVLFVPVFGTNPSYITFSLIENGPIFSHKNMKLTQIRLDVVVAPQFSIAIRATSTLEFSNNDVVTFNIAGSFQENALVTFTGDMVGTWPHPFNLQWLSVTGVHTKLVINAANGQLQSFVVGGSADMTFPKFHMTGTFEIVIGKSIKDITFTLTVDCQYQLHEVAAAITNGDVPAVFKEAKSLNGQLVLTISTVTNGETRDGLSIAMKASVPPTSELMKKMQVVVPHIDSFELVAAIHIPIFSTNPSHIDLQLQFNAEITIVKDKFYFEQLAFTFAVDSGLTVGVSARVRAHFATNPTLWFLLAGTYSTSQTVTLTGEMIGTWVNPFGIKGFNVSDVIGEIGFNPAMCEIDACLADIGVGFKVSLGTITVEFDGRAAIPDWEKIFAYASVSGKNGYIFTVRDLVSTWNNMAPQHQIPLSLIPNGWGLKDSMAYFAPQDQQFGNKFFKKGFEVKGGITILDLDVDFDVQCHDTTITPNACSFDFHFHFDLVAFAKMIKRELFGAGMITAEEYENPQFALFAVRSVELEDFSTGVLAQNTNPRFRVQLEILGIKRNVDVRMPPAELAGSFHSYFGKFLRHLFL